MRLTLLCIGRTKAGAERDLAARYLDRAKLAGRSVGLVVEGGEIEESRARRPDDRKSDEAKAILAALPLDTSIIACDETGATLDSAAFARLVSDARDDGLPSLALVIGGPDGFDSSFRQKAGHIIAFGAMTWPHQLVRIMAAEQIYRAVTILAGHPYHRA